MFTSLASAILLARYRSGLCIAHIAPFSWGTLSRRSGDLILKRSPPAEGSKVNVPRRANDPDVIGQTTGLIGFLKEVVQSSHNRLRDDRRSRERLWLADLPASIRRPSDRVDGLLLTLDHVPQTAPPPLPDVLEGWVSAERCLDADGGDPPLAVEGPGRELVRAEDGRQWWEEAEDHSVRREDAAEVLRSYGPWLDRWRRWAERERAERALRELYEQVYHWHQKLTQQDDQLELVLATGLLTWSDPRGEAVHRHLLTHRVETSVDRKTARVTVRLMAEGAVRLEDQAFLDTDDGWAPERSAALAEEIAAQSMHLLGTEALEQLAQWQERVLQRPVTFSAEWQPPREAEAGARLTYAPALVVRPRDRNALLSFYDRISDSVASEANAPLGLAQLVLTLNSEERANWGGREIPPLFGDDPLFPGKTNERQRSVLRRLEHDTGVVVQGPPGTGKTHTIANLVSALLAQGQRVLVTSARDQALTVLRDKLPLAVRDLCVLLLSSARQDGADELERTINALTDQVATSDPEQLRDEIRRLSARREEVQGRISTLTEQVIALREAEVYRHREIAPGYAGTLAAIVQRVRDNAERHSWIGVVPDQGPAPSAPPLSPAQAAELLILLRDGAAEPRAGGTLPDPDTLPTPEDVAQVLAASRVTDDGLSLEAADVRDQLAQLDSSLTDELTSLAGDCRTALHHLGLSPSASQWDADKWTTKALSDRLSRENLPQWRRVSGLADQLTAVSEQLDEHGMKRVIVPDQLSAERADAMLTTGTALRDHVASGGKLRPRGSFRAAKAQKAAQELLDTCTVNGRSPETLEDLDSVLTHLHAHSSVATLAERWAQAGVPTSEGPVELRLASLTEAYARLKHVDAFGTARERIDDLLVRHGLHIALISRPAWEVFTTALASLSGRRTADEAMAQLVTWEEHLRTPVEGAPPAAEALAAAQAVREQDIDRYAKEVEALREAHRREHRRRRCSVLLDGVRRAHPSLADQLTQEPDDPAWATRLDALADAWAWAVASAFVRRERTPGQERHLEGELAQYERNLEDLTGELAATWGRLHCLERMTQEQRSALQAYRTHMASYGKGKGRSAGRYRAAAHDAMRTAQGAVPAWVMPISQVAEMVLPKRDAFDVVIVDEASQAGMDALFLMWLAPRVIVVGDDKQCAPSLSSLGRHQAIHDRLISHLPDMPPSLRTLYGPATNLYQLLSTFFPKVIRLEEHFRCMPEIIGWSSQTFYNNKLQPLRQYGGDRLDPLVTHFVEGAVTQGRDSRLRNPQEAEAIVGCLAQLVEDPAYRDKTMGVITLQGPVGQVKLLEQLINERIPAPVRERHQMRVGNPASFQGDERHVILLSMVATDPPRIAGGARSERQAYNVAASRAQDQMRLFYSVPPDRLKSGDLRLNLLAYMENPPSALANADDIGEVSSEVPQKPFESLFEQHVYLRLKARGYHVIPQYPAGSKRIDLVVVGARGRLAVECDGERYHSTPLQVRHDQQRDRELQRVGWTFWRIPESEFRFDPDDALTGLWEELNRLGIRPATFGGADDQSHAVSASPGVQWTPLDLSSNEDLAADPAETADGPDATDPVAALALTEDDELDVTSTEGAA
ncbi:AAA domain-containing protein [Streptomyces sp. NBC_00124]|uniref:AAA domain-containing protein n=1 Tax=Streptomyces sp. NBC_00124 TaxID=2975662 RepID=UPI002252C272|nr:AAA domain-containing protein [Streptomyces sp. NBC_00124]MCX5365523.1 AAA domain-containing protein [Streptomyces sp. NBC_00124]